MLGDIFGNMEEKQAEMKKKLAEMTVEASAGDGAISIQANANRQILNISIDGNNLDLSDTEQLEDLLLVGINRALDLAAEKEAAEAENLMKDLLPPGMGGLGDLFG